MGYIRTHAWRIMIPDFKFWRAVGWKKELSYDQQPKKADIRSI